jgi:hypothetical protein
MFEYFYHEILRKTVIGFGTLFNDISIKHFDKDKNSYSSIKVPLVYGPRQKFLARLEESPNLNKPIQMTLPRMSFEMIGISYDSSRKITTTQTFSVYDENDKEIKKIFMPVPYNVSFELNIMTKINDDMLQIVEQILPYFQPQYNLTIRLLPGVNEKRDIPIVLENISMQDDYEGNFTTRRTLIYTLRFTAKTYLFGPIPSDSSGLIKKVTIDYGIGGKMDTSNTIRQVRYTATPKALQDYNEDSSTTLAEDLIFDSNYAEVANGDIIPEKSYITINEETMYVKTKSGNKLAVERKNAINHTAGSIVNLVNQSDDVLVDPDDDFGFNGETTFFADYRQYATSLNEDI